MTSHPLGVSRTTFPSATAKALSTQRAARSLAERANPARRSPAPFSVPAKYARAGLRPPRVLPRRPPAGPGPRCQPGRRPNLEGSICGPDAGSCAPRFPTRRTVLRTSTPSCAARRIAGEQSWTPHTPRTPPSASRSTARRYSCSNRPSLGRVSRRSATARPRGVAGSTLRPYRLT